MNALTVTVICGAFVSAVTASLLMWKIIRFFSKMIYLIDTCGPTILEIGTQFKKNGGSSLKDQIDRIEEVASAAAKLADDAHKAASNSHELVVRLDENVRAIRRQVEPAQRLTDPNV